MFTDTPALQGHTDYWVYSCTDRLAVRRILTLALQTHWLNRHTDSTDTRCTDTLALDTLPLQTHWLNKCTDSTDTLTLQTHWLYRHAYSTDSLINIFLVICRFDVNMYVRHWCAWVRVSERGTEGDGEEQKNGLRGENWRQGFSKIVPNVITSTGKWMRDSQDQTTVKIPNIIWAKTYWWSSRSKYLCKISVFNYKHIPVSDDNREGDSVTYHETHLLVHNVLNEGGRVSQGLVTVTKTMPETPNHITHCTTGHTQVAALCTICSLWSL